MKSQAHSIPASMQLAREHYENFPVARFVSKHAREDIKAIYAFARMADDFADEPEYEGKRLEYLAAWRDRLHQCAEGKAQDPVFQALSKTMVDKKLPMAWLDDLLKAFEYDVTHPRHKNFEALLTYSKLSANPVGKCVLHVHGYHEQKMHAMSDQLCTGLQLVNFWQDIGVDAQRGRFYLPQDELKAGGCTEAQLVAHQESQALADLVKKMCDQTQTFFDQSKSLSRQLSFPLSLEIALTHRGGQRILDKIKKQGYQVLGRRPKVSKMEALFLTLQCLVGIR